MVVVLKLKDLCQQITKMNPLKLREKLESILPGGVVWPNRHLNVLAIDTKSIESTKCMLTIHNIDEIQLQADEHRYRAAAV